jgi:DNA-binding NtrC family response regulator
MDEVFGPTVRTLTLKRSHPQGPRYLLVPAEHRVVLLEGDCIRIGTSADCELCLSDPAVSRIHCEVRHRSGRVAVRDLGSKNGVVLQSVRVSAGEMRLGDTLRLGETVIVLVDKDRSEPSRAGEVLPGIVGVSEVMRRMARTVRLLAPSDLNVLVTGETGTGKELVARALHGLSSRSGGPFVALNCSSIPRDLIESELFGHERGAFTGAVDSRPGLFEQAEGGTLLLDEIGELPLEQQPQLLRVMETGRVRRVGGQAAREVDVRVVSATHVAMNQALSGGRFRRDLFYRVNEAEVRVPSLAERGDDILPLLERFLEELPAGSVRPDPITLGRLQTRCYRGNVRELRSLVRRAVVLGWSEVDETTFPDPAGRLVPNAVSPVRGAGAAESSPAYAGTFEQIQRRIMADALEQAEGNKALAARKLGMAKSTFNDRLRRLLPGVNT